jgi:predicted RNA-binding protein (virulence factor B family)
VTPEQLGRSVTLEIRRFAPTGAYLALDDEHDILLIGSEIPEGAQVGDPVDVFVHLDSEARPIATIRESKLELGEVAFLEVREVTGFGAFVDWGLAKELFVPFAEQTATLHVGARHPFGLYVDDTGRLAATMRVTEMLARSVDEAEWARGEWISGEAWRFDPEIGLFVIVERSFVGLVPAHEPHRLTRGEAARFRIAEILPDGKLELTLRRHAHEELEDDGKRILEGLAKPGALPIGDKSGPDEIRDRFGLSKKAFKRALGRLLKEGAIEIDAGGFPRARPKR